MLRRMVYGGATDAGLSTVLPLLQTGHRRELTTEPHWSKEELVRHPEPRELIRSMRKPGNLDEQGRPVYTLDERRSLTADIYENRVVKQTVERVQRRLDELATDDEPTGARRGAGARPGARRRPAGRRRSSTRSGSSAGRTCPRRP